VGRKSRQTLRVCSLTKVAATGDFCAGCGKVAAEKEKAAVSPEVLISRRSHQNY
jgi:hypothetical protein